MRLFPTDFVVITKDNSPLRYSNNEIGLWSEDNLSEIRLIECEKLIPSTELLEPFKSELINQLINNQGL